MWTEDDIPIIREYLSYDGTTLRWKKSPRPNVMVGDDAIGVYCGHHITLPDRLTISPLQAIWLLVYGVPASGRVCRLDHRLPVTIDNLYDSSPGEAGTPGAEAETRARRVRPEAPIPCVSDTPDDIAKALASLSPEAFVRLRECCAELLTYADRAGITPEVIAERRRHRRHVSSAT